MSHSISSTSIVRMPFPNHVSSSTSKLQQPMIQIRTRTQTHMQCFNTKCELNEESTSTGRSSATKLSIGSPIIITEAPKMVKTAASVPCLRLNDGLVNPGDVGRIVSRKPMDVWAVRLSIGTYLIDRKYFKPLELDE